MHRGGKPISDKVIEWYRERHGWTGFTVITQPGKSGTKKVDKTSLLEILGFLDRFVQDFPGK